MAKTKRGTALCSLHHVIDLDWMKEAYRLTRKDGAPGIDGVVTAEDYEANLEANLLDLLERIKSGHYRAPPVRRAYIPKADGSQRMLGIPTLEDKVAQRAVMMMLEAVYEQDFLPCSYGFRPGRSAHQALRTLQNVLWAKRLYWVIDIDIRKYFDSIPHSHLQRLPLAEGSRSRQLAQHGLSSSEKLCGILVPGRSEGGGPGRPCASPVKTPSKGEKPPRRGRA